MAYNFELVRFSEKNFQGFSLDIESKRRIIELGLPKVRDAGTKLHLEPRLSSISISEKNYLSLFEAKIYNDYTLILKENTVFSLTYSNQEPIFVSSNLELFCNSFQYYYNFITDFEYSCTHEYESTFSNEKNYYKTLASKFSSLKNQLYIIDKQALSSKEYFWSRVLFNIKLEFGDWLITLED